MNPREASMATRPWVISDSLHLLNSLTGRGLDAARAKRSAGSKMLGNGWVTPGKDLASAGQERYNKHVRTPTLRHLRFQHPENDKHDTSKINPDNIFSIFTSTHVALAAALGWMAMWLPLTITTNPPPPLLPATTATLTKF